MIDYRGNKNCWKDSQSFAPNEIKTGIETMKSDIKSVKSSDVCRPVQEDTSWIGIREPEGGIPKRKMNRDSTKEPAE